MIINICKNKKTPTVETVRVILAKKVENKPSCERLYRRLFWFLRFPLPFEKYLSVTVN
jgi:hypothetical protein